MSTAPPILSRYKPPSPAWRYTLRLLALLGLALTSFLLYQSLTTTANLPGCGPGSPCETVLSSRWSKVLTLPVSAPAFLLYVIIIAASLHLHPTSPPRRQRYAWRTLLFAAIALLAAALWFTAVQLWIIHALCKYCTTTHAVGLILAAFILWRAPVGRLRLLPDEPPDPLLLSPPSAAAVSALALVAVALLLAAQLLFPPPSVQAQQRGHLADFDTGPGPNRRISILGQQIHLSPHQLPVRGSLDAPTLIVELYDYTCPHCRRMHHHLTKAQQRYANQFALVKLPAPLDSDCNPLVDHTEPRHEHGCEIATLAMAVWKADPARFPQFDDWLFESQDPRSPADARAYAESLVGAQPLEHALADPWVTEQIPRNVTVYQFTGGILPQLIIGQTVIHGGPDSPDELFQILEANTSLRPRATEP